MFWILTKMSSVKAAVREMMPAAFFVHVYFFFTIMQSKHTFNTSQRDSGGKEAFRSKR